MTVRIYQDDSRADPRTEDYHQMDVASWIDYNYPDVYWFHPVNENAGKAFIQYFTKQKRKGLKKGVVDIVIHARGINGEPFGVIELKRCKKFRPSTVSPEQWECLRNADEQGAFAAVVYGFQQCKIALADFLGEPRPIPRKR